MHLPAPRGLGRYLAALLLFGGFGSLLVSKPLYRHFRRERVLEADLHAEFPLEATNDSPPFWLPEPPSTAKLDPWDTSHAVVGPPTKHFRGTCLNCA